jgi:DNA ligase-1
MSCQLCGVYDIETGKLPFQDTWISRKVDGVRLLLIKKGNSNFYPLSRNNHTYKSLNSLCFELTDKFSKDKDIVLDGELVILDKSTYNHNFNATVSCLNSDNFNDRIYLYYIFDQLSLSEYESGIGTSLYRDKYCDMIVHKSKYETEHSVLLMNIEVDIFSDLQNHFRTALNLGWEGLVLRNGGSVYCGKRSKNLLKLKKFKSGIYKVLSYQTGKGLLKDCLGSIEISLGNGNNCFVGTGFSSKERITLWEEFKTKNKVRELCEISYFEETTNKSGTKSLRFPKFIRWI